MVDEFKHAIVGTSLTKTEWESVDTHVANGQTTNDLLYFNGFNWVRAQPNKIKQVLNIYPVVGIEWDTGTDTWTRIDEQGNAWTPFPWSFDDLYPWCEMRRCCLDENGFETEVSANGKGADITLDGTNGRVMVRVPRFYVKAEQPSAGVYRWWISPVAKSGFEVHPWFRQNGKDAEFAYIAAYEADFIYDAVNAWYELHSRSGVQPWTGGQIWEVDFDGGTNAPAIGDSLSTDVPPPAAWAASTAYSLGDLVTPTAGFNGFYYECTTAGTSGTAEPTWPTTDGTTVTDGTVVWTARAKTISGFLLVDYVVTSGGWGTGDAAGKLWVRQPGVGSCDWLDNQTITNDTAALTLGNVNINVTALSLTIGDARTYAGNIGTDWLQMDIWGKSAIQLLIYIENGGPDAQTDIGRGIVDKLIGTGFNGELTGADLIDSNLATNGTGSGTGTDGLTPIAYRGIENFWGNVWKFVDGYNAIDAEYQVLDKQGTNTPQDDMDLGQTPLVSQATPITADGYIDDVLFDPGFEYSFLGTSVTGSSSTALCDYQWSHDAGETNILLAGGNWPNGSRAGVGCLVSYCVASTSNRSIGTRLVFIP